MSQWISSFIQSSRKTKYFILTTAIYGLALILTTLYCYARLDFVRSGKSSPSEPGQIIGYKSK